MEADFSRLCHIPNEMSKWKKFVQDIVVGQLGDVVHPLLCECEVCVAVSF